MGGGDWKKDMGDKMTIQERGCLWKGGSNFCILCSFLENNPQVGINKIVNEDTADYRGSSLGLIYLFIYF